MAKPLTILHLEDNVTDAELVEEKLSSLGFESDISRVESKEEFIAALRNETIDLIFADVSLPSFDGMSALHIARELRPDVPFIFISGTIGEDIAIESLLNGATDYVLKNKFERLVPAVTRALRESEMLRERMRAEEELRESEKRYKILFDSNPHPMWVYDSETLCFLAVNNAAVSDYGYSREEFLSMTIMNIRPQEDLALLSQNLYDVPPEFEKSGSWRHQKKDGTIIHVDVSSHEVPFNGRMGRLVLANNVTERKRAEESLRHERTLLRTLIDNLPDAIYVKDITSRKIVANSADLRTMGRHSESEVLGKDDFAFFPKETAERFLVDDQSVITSGMPVINREEYFIDEQGKKHWMLTSKLPFRGDQNEIVGIIGIGRDITEHKQAEEELHKSEENYRSLFESAHDAIFTISPDGILTNLNKAFETVTGWKREEWIGKTLGDLLHPDDRSIALIGFSKVINGKMIPAQEYRIKSKPGIYRIGEFTITPQVRGGDVVGVLGIARDVTEQRKFEEQLRQTKKMESIGTLAGGIAHDFNNILGIILAYITYMQYVQNDPVTTAKNIEAITNAVKRGSSLVRQLLTFAKQTNIRFESVSISDLVNELITMLRATFPKIIDFSIEIENDLPRIIADQSQIHQVFLNLCVNARDAMPGGGLITFAAAVVSKTQIQHRFSEASSETYIQIQITDTGTGMDEKTVNRIFEPFYTTKGKDKGTGLGLSVVYGVIQSHKGFIEVESKIGLGTTFHLYLPTEQSATESVQSVPDEEDEIKGGTETLLLVEDEELLIYLVQSVLETKGYKILTAKDGMEALDVYRQHQNKIALVLTDMGLPKLGGWDMMQKIKEIDPRIPVIFASGFLEPGMLDQIERLENSSFVQKPYDPNNILIKIRGLLDKLRTEQSS